MRVLATLLFGVAAVINLLPGLGVLSASRLEAFYGVALQDPNLVILMRHRAVVIAIVGGVLATSMFLPALRPLAVVLGLVSMLSFVAIALTAEPNALLRRVAWIDVAASVALVAGALLDRFDATGVGAR